MASSLTEDDLELLDPHPDIHALFVHYNTLYFANQLGACSVEWSSARMTLCGGVCEFRPGGGCRIKLSEPLLKLRPSRDLKMVLLHEMIHASMMLRGTRDDDPGGHGTIFKAIMARINASTLPDHQRPAGGYNITTTHSMFAEVGFYRQHHWRCERCGNVIKRAMNRAPQEADCRLHVRGRDCCDRACQYHLHLRHCGGQWVKIKEPEGFGDRQRKKGRAPGGRGSAGGGSSAGQGSSGTGDSAARADGAPLPAKRPKQGDGTGAGSRPITDFFPSTGPSSPPLSALQRGAEQVAARSAAVAAAPNGRDVGAVLPAIQAVQQQQQQQQQLGQQRSEEQELQQRWRQQQAEPSAEERRRLLAEAALRRLGRAGEPMAAPAQQEQQQHGQQQAEQQAEQQRLQGPPPPPPQRQPGQEQRQIPRGPALPARSPGFVDLACSDDKGGGLSRPVPRPSQQQQQQQQQRRRQAGAGTGGAAGGAAPVASVRFDGASSAAAPAEAAGASPQATAGMCPAVACPVCGKHWPPAAGASSMQLNAELNAHIDECLTLSALAE